MIMPIKNGLIEFLKTNSGLCLLLLRGLLKSHVLFRLHLLLHCYTLLFVLVRIVKKLICTPTQLGRLSRLLLIAFILFLEIECGSYFSSRSTNFKFSLSTNPSWILNSIRETNSEIQVLRCNTEITCTNMVMGVINRNHI